MNILLLGESFAVLILAFLATTCMRTRSAAERHTVWLAGFAALLLLPLGRILPVSLNSPPPALLIAVGASIPASPASADTRDLALNVWILGVVLCLTRIAIGIVRGLILARRGADAGMSLRYQTRYVSDLQGPVSWGIGRKLILLPASAATWGEDRKAVVLSHESAHLRRNDCWALLIAEIACALFWCNPLTWLAAVHLRREQEHAADDDVLNGGADPAAYAGHLVALAKATRTPLLSAGAITRSQLSARVEAILDQRRVRRMPTRTMITATVCALLAIAFPLASMQAERKVERIGGDVTPPRVVHKQEPKYTDEAREAKIEGSVTLSVIVEPDGRIYDAKVTRSLDPGLDANALLAVRTWVFEPATKAGNPVAVSANIEVNFRLL
jgi:TonB family protein